MATPGMQTGRVVGTVKGVDGVVTAINERGVIRILKPGDKVYAGETIQTADGANAHIDFSKGGFATLGADQSLPLDGAILSQAAEAARPQQGQTQAPAATGEEIEKLQQQIEEAIAKGEDPTALLEAAAAGPGAGGGGGEEGSSFVTVEQLAARGQLTPGFETGTFGYVFENPEEYYGERRFWSPDFSFTDEHGLPMAGLFLTLYEGGLPGGNKTGGDKTSGTGHFLIDTHNEGLSGLTIAGQDVMAALGGGGPVPVTIPGFPGVFYIDSITAGPNGVYTVNYRYELTGTVDNASGEDARDFSFPIVITDGVGGHTTMPTGRITVVDDNPLADDDYRTLAETNAGDTWLSGNVVDGSKHDKGAGVAGDTGNDTPDKPGADGLAATDPVAWNTSGVTTDNMPSSTDGSQGFQPNDPAFKTDFSLVGSGPTYTVMDGSKTVGTLTLNPDGSYRFDMDPSYEPEHGNHTINIPYTVTDDDGDTADAVLHITLENVNDTPVLTVDTGEVKETGVYAPGDRGTHVQDGAGGRPDENTGTTAGGVAADKHQLTASGQLTATDADGDSMTFGAGTPGAGQSVTNNPDGSYTIHGKYGDLTIQPDGSWTFVLKDGAANHLAEDQHITEDFPVSVTDNSGQANGTANGNIPITIHGSNDAPTLSMGSNLVVDEGTGNTLSSGSIVNNTANTTVSGQATATDADDGANLRFGFETADGRSVTTLYVDASGNLVESAPGDGNYYGTLTIDPATGQYTFTLNNGAPCVQKLNEGDNPTFTVPVVVEDEHGAYDKGSFDVTVTGRNDSPFITGGNTGIVRESGVYAPGNRGSILHDGDYPGSGTKYDENTPTVDGGVAAGRHQLVVDGQLTAADVDNDVSGLTFSVKSGTAMGSGIGQWEPGTFPGTGDACQIFHGRYGDLYLKSDGTYRYVLDDTRPATQRLTETGPAPEKFPVQVNDPNGGTGDGSIDITVRGSNDAPVFVAGDHSYVMAEDGGSYTLTGKMTATDVDFQETEKLNYSFEAPDGSVVQVLYAVPDGSGGIVFTTTAPADGNYYGRFTIDKTTGNYQFEMNNGAPCVQSLGEGDSKTITAPVVVVDPYGAYDKDSIDVTVTGRNDAPLITGGNTGTVKESGVYAPGSRGSILHDGDYPGSGTKYDENKPTADGGITSDRHQLTTDGQLTATDVDNDVGDLTFAGRGAGWQPGTFPGTGDACQVYHGKYGDLYLKSDGTYRYVLDDTRADTQALKEGQTVTENFPVQVNDPHGGAGNGTVSISVRGSNDAPVFAAGTHDYILTEDSGSYTLTGQVTATDVDNGDTAQLNYGLEAPDGSVVQVLYAVPDGSGGIVFTTSAPADGNYYGRFTIDKTTGDYKFEMNNGAPCVQTMGEGDSTRITVPVVVVDPQGAYDKKDIGVTINGSDDPASIDMTALNPIHTVIEAGVLPGGNVDYAGQLTVKGTLHAGDPDSADNLVYKVKGKDGTWHTLGDIADPAYDPATGTWIIETEHGTAVFSPSTDPRYSGGYDYEYTLNNNDPAVNALDRQELLPGGDGFGVRVESERPDGTTDSTDANVSISIVGTNDRPEIKSNLITVGKDDTDNALDGIFSGKVLVSDVDKGHHGNTPDELADGSYNLVVTGAGGANFVEVYDTGGNVVGMANIKPDGSYTIELNDYGKGLLRGMAEGEYLEVTTRIRVTDPNKAYSETDVTWRLEGQDDAPVLWNASSSASGIREDGWKSGRPLILNGGTLEPNPDYAKDDRPDSINGQLMATRVDKTAPGAGDFIYTLQGDTDGDGVLYVLPDGSGGYTLSDTPPAAGADWIGRITLNRDDGKWTFDLNQDSETVNRMKEGDSLDVSIPARVDDARNPYHADGSINIAINGANDRPDITTYDDTLTLTDQGRVPDSYVVSGDAAASDPDNIVFDNAGNPGGTTGNAGDSEITFCFIDPVTSQPTQTLQLDHGSVTIDPKTGRYTYTYDMFDDSNYDSPNGDGTTSYATQEKFTVYARDKDGAYSEGRDVVVNVGPHDKWTHGSGGPGTGTIDAGTNDLAVQEDNGDPTGKGDASVRTGDVPGNQVTGGDGYYFIDSAGNKVQSVPAVDAAGNKYGSFVIDPFTGKYELILDNGSDLVQRLNDGERVDLVPPTVGNFGNGGTTTLPPSYITGTNDIPEFGQDIYRHGLTETTDFAGGDSVSGNLAATDMDQGGALGDTLTFGAGTPGAGQSVADNGDGSYTIHGTYGDLLVKPDGSYTYTVRPGVNIPHNADDEVFNVIVKDEKGATDNAQVIIDLDGKNTAPVYGGPALDTLEVTEDTGAVDGYITDAGSIDRGQFTDADNDTVTLKVAPDNNADGVPDNSGAAYAIGKYGTLFLKPDGTYEYRLNNNNEAVQALKDGESLEDRFFIIADDGHGGTTQVPLSVKVNGTNDDPVLSLNDPTGARFGAGVSLDMVEGQTAPVGGKAVATDVDSSDTYFRYSFKDPADGSLKDSVDAVAMIDGVPVVVGQFVIDRNTGEYLFVPNSNIDQLKAGQQISVKGEVVVESSSNPITDGSPADGGSSSAEVTVNITGTNNAPDMVMVTLDMEEDSGAYTQTGQITPLDPDAGPGERPSFSVKAGGDVTQTGPTTWEGKYGTLTLNPDGTYSYTLHNDKVQSLGEGETATDSFDILTRDKYGATSETPGGIKVEITGTNDAPELTVTAADVGQAGTITGQFVGTDVDAHDVLTYSVDGAVADATEAGYTHRVDGVYGTLYYNEADGTYKYVAKDDTKSLGQGETAQDSFNVKVTDNHGASDSSPLDVTIRGTNEAPTLDAATEGLALTAAVDSLAGALSFADVDVNDTLTLSVDGTAITADGTVIHGLYGDLTVNPDGTYTYELNHSPETLDALAHAGSLAENFVTSVQDNHGGSSGDSSLSINITSTGEVHDAYLGTGTSDTLTADDTHHQLYGGAGDDILIGSTGNDILYGGTGNDILTGGAGDNLLVGGEGSDTFMYDMHSLDGKTAGDVIQDFHVGNLDSSHGGVDAQADVLDLSDLLSGLKTENSLASTTDIGTLIQDGYITLNAHQESDGSTTVVLGVDRDGAAGSAHGADTLATIHMDGITFDPGAGTTLEQQLLDQLMQNQQIKFD